MRNILFIIFIFRIKNLENKTKKEFSWNLEPWRFWTILRFASGEKALRPSKVLPDCKRRLKIKKYKFITWTISLCHLTLVIFENLPAINTRLLHDREEKYFFIVFQLFLMFKVSIVICNLAEVSEVLATPSLKLGRQSVVCLSLRGIWHGFVSCHVTATRDGS